MCILDTVEYSSVIRFWLESPVSTFIGRTGTFTTGFRYLILIEHERAEAHALVNGHRGLLVLVLHTRPSVAHDGVEGGAEGADHVDDHRAWTTVRE